MVLHSIYDSAGQTHPCLYSSQPEPIGRLLSAMTDGAYLAAHWADPTAEVPLAALEKELGHKLLVPERWQYIFPQTGLLISSSISGGDLKSRFREAAERGPNRCWLLLEPMSMAFSLPCPDGQGQPVEPPEAKGFYSEALGCRYVHSPGQVILFDTDETLAQKRQWAMAAGFLGWLDIQKLP